MDRPRIRHRDPVVPLPPGGLDAAHADACRQMDAARTAEAQARQRIEAAHLRLATARAHCEQAAEERDRRRNRQRAAASQVALLHDLARRLTQAQAAEERACHAVTAATTTVQEARGFTALMRTVATAARAHAQRWRAAAQRAATVIRSWIETTEAARAATRAQEAARACLTVAEAAARDAWSAVISTHLAAGAARQVAAAHAQAITGVQQTGLVRYLARAAPAARQVIQAAQQEAVADGQARAGRRPAACRDEVAAARRAQRAERARERRRNHLVDPTTPAAEARRAQHREDRRRQRAAERADIDPAVDGSRPAVRQHDQRMATLAPEERARYRAHLILARQAGRGAAIREAERIAAHPTVVWAGQADAIPLGKGARLIAVRHGDAATLAQALMGQDPDLEAWLGAPALERNQLYGPGARLTHVAGHLIAAWSPALAALAAAGELDAALAYEVDRVIARLGLEQHRVVAFLHLDSDSGHPHLHLLFSRVRLTDHALWSLSGRERTPALWLHGRTTTVLARGANALEDDVDALAGRGPAAQAGECLMWQDQLAATRTHLDRSVEVVPLQGPVAAQRIAAVGSFSGDHGLAGGLWKFGMGVDPQQLGAWRGAVEAARQSGDAARIAQAVTVRPKNRGYWLPIDRDAPPGHAWRHSERFGWYLARVQRVA